MAFDKVDDKRPRASHVWPNLFTSLTLSFEERQPKEVLNVENMDNSILNLNTFAAANLPVIDKVHIGFQNSRQPLFETEIREVDVTNLALMESVELFFYTLFESQGVR